MNEAVLVDAPTRKEEHKVRTYFRSHERHDRRCGTPSDAFDDLIDRNFLAADRALALRGSRVDGARQALETEPAKPGEAYS